MSWRLTSPKFKIFDAELNNQTKDSVSKVIGTPTDLGYVEGPYGKSIADFNASTSKIDFGSDRFGLGNISISALIKLDGWGENNLGIIIGNGKLIFQVWATQEKILFSRTGTEGVTASAISSLALNGLYHIVVTSTSAGITNFYIDTKPNWTADQPAGTPEAGTENTIIGNRNAGDRTFDGGIGKVKAYGCILTRDEIIALNRMDKRI